MSASVYERSGKLKNGDGEDQGNSGFAGAVSSQFEPTAADGDSESCSDQAQNQIKNNHGRSGKCMQHVAGEGVVMKVHCCSVVEA